MDTIGQRIRYVRKMSKLSLTDIKEMTGLSTGNLSELENDKFAPSANALISLRKVFNVHIDWILTGEPPMALSNCESVKEEQSPYLSDEEKKFIGTYRALDEEKRRNIQGYMQVVTQCQKEKTE